VTRSKTHNRYFPTFEDLIAAVTAGLNQFLGAPADVKRLMGTYLDEQADCPLAA